MNRFIQLSIIGFAIVFLVGTTTTADAQIRKSVSILGDSYSTYRGFLQPDTNHVWYENVKEKCKNDVTKVTETWWHLFIKENGYKLCVNNSFSGATICYTGYKKEPNRDHRNRSYVNRVPYLGNPDIILVFGGTNDSWAGSPIGEYKYADWTETDLWMFRPAMACMFSRLLEYYPNVEIYFILNNELKPSINESCKTICEYYNIPLIELQNIDKQRGHPSVLGMKQIAEQVAKVVNKD